MLYALLFANSKRLQLTISFPIDTFLYKDWSIKCKRISKQKKPTTTSQSPIWCHHLPCLSDQPSHKKQSSTSSQLRRCNNGKFGIFAISNASRVFPPPPLPPPPLCTCSSSICIVWWLQYSHKSSPVLCIVTYLLQLGVTAAVFQSVPLSSPPYQNMTCYGRKMIWNFYLVT